MRVGHAEQRVARVLPGVDQRADVGVALGDHAVEGRQHALEGLQLLQACDVGGRRLARRGLGGGVTGALIGVLLRDRLGRRAVPASAHWSCVRARSWPARSPGPPAPAAAPDPLPGVSISASSCALLHRRADVGVPDLQIAVGARVDRRFVEGLHAAWQHQGVGARALARLRRGRPWRLPRSRRRCSERGARADAAHDAPDGEDERDADEDAARSAGRRRLVRRVAAGDDGWSDITCCSAACESW